MNNDKYDISDMKNELDTSQDVQAFQRDMALNRLSFIIHQQARRKATIIDNISTNENSIEETLKQTTSTFMQNLDKISKMDIMNEKIDDIELEDAGDNDNIETSTILKNENFMKMRESIIADHKANMFLSPNVSIALDTTSYDKHYKTLHMDESGTASEHLNPSTDTLSSKIEGSENIEMQSTQMKEPPIDSFTPLEAAAISCVLEECLDQLATIGFMIPAKIDPRWDDTFKTIDETYGVPDEPRTIFREDMDLLPVVPTAAEKMQRDRNYVYKVLEKVLHDVRNNRRFDSLKEEIDKIKKKREGERYLETNAQISHSQAEQLRKLLESTKEANEEYRKKMIKLAQESDAQVDHAIFLNSGKLGYAERWEKARLEQQELKLKLQKTDMLNKLSDYSKEYSAEQIISAEVSAYLEADIKEKEEQIDTWTQKYNEELIQRQQEIDELQKKIEEQKLQIKEMRALKDERQKFIDEYIAEKERLQEEEKLNRAATIIQSAWRSYMVRHELGKYKNLRKRLKRRKKLSKMKKAASSKKER